jgi:hypothetical protein
MKLRNQFSPVLRNLFVTGAATTLLIACGGGNGDGGDSASQASDTVVLKGQVVDGPVTGAQVCLFSNGEQVRNSAGTAICSGDTDAQGNYTITIPRDLAPGFVTLIASKGSDIKLASVLGTLAQVFEAAGNDGTVSPDSLPAARVTHLTTADFALADANNDGTVSKDERDAYASDFAKVQKVAAVIKTVIDFQAQAGSLIGGQTTNTLALASAAARNEKLGSTNKTADQWLADPDNAKVIAAVNQDVAKDMEGRFANYSFSTKVTSSHIPPTVVRNNGTASIYCGVGTGEESTKVQIAFDAARRIIVIKHEDGQMVGSYNPQTGKVSLNEYNPPETTVTGSSGITFYSENSFNLSGTLDASTGNITGSFAEMSATTWTLDSTRQACTAEGSFTATKL